MFRFTIRDVPWLTVVDPTLAGWIIAVWIVLLTVNRAD
jgi:hypothetical protein